MMQMQPKGSRPPLCGLLDKVSLRWLLDGRTIWSLCWECLVNPCICFFKIKSLYGCMWLLKYIQVSFDFTCFRLTSSRTGRKLMSWWSCILTKHIRTPILISMNWLTWFPRYVQDQQMRTMVDTHIRILRSQGFDRMYPWGTDSSWKGVRFELVKKIPPGSYFERIAGQEDVENTRALIGKETQAIYNIINTFFLWAINASCLVYISWSQLAVYMWATWLFAHVFI